MIDAHQHFWELERGYYDWLTEDLEALHSDFLPSDLESVLSANQLSGTILVQAAATEAETRFCFELARSHPWIKAVTGWVDLESKNFHDRLQGLIIDGGGLLKALRPMIQDISDTNWIARPYLDASIQSLADAGIMLEALVKPRHLGALEARLRRHENLRCVIDHCAKPRIAEREIDDWANDMRSLAKLPQVTGVKLSGLLTEARAEDGAAELQPYVTTVIEAFGTDRILWGSDWPVLNLASDYSKWLDIARELTHDLSVNERNAIFGGNAGQIYGVESGRER